MGNYTYVQTGRLYANNGTDFLNVERIKYYYDTVGYEFSSRKLDVDINPNVEYMHKNINWATIGPHTQISNITNCYGYTLADGSYYINESTVNIINYLKADGYKNIGKPSLSMKYNAGDLILFEGHIIEAVNKNGIVQWESYWAGDSSAKYGSLVKVLSEITIGGSNTELKNAV